MNISLVTIAHNEAARIVDHCERAAVYCDEMIVVVQDSDDDTAELAATTGATVLRDRCHGISEPSRGLAISHTTCPWVMYLDADEHLDESKVPLLPDIMDRYLMARLSVGAWTDGVRTDPVMPDGRYHQNRQIRFFRKDRVKWGNTNHSRFEPLHEYFSMPDSVFWSQGDEPWILNIKNADEAAVDAARYARLGR